MNLIFIRHGDPDYSIDSLTEKGWREAELLSLRTTRWKVAQFYCSPLGRARDTASLTLQKLGREATVCDWLKEFYIKVADPETGKPRTPWDFMPRYWTKEAMLYEKDLWYRAPIMQTGAVEEEFLKVKSGIDSILLAHGYRRSGAFYQAEHANTDTLVFFCHLGVQFAILSHLLGIAAPLLWQGFFVAPTSVTVLTSEERVKGEAYFRVKTIGDTAHLREGGEPVSNSGFFQEIYPSSPEWQPAKTWQF